MNSDLDICEMCVCDFFFFMCPLFICLFVCLLIVPTNEARVFPCRGYCVQECQTASAHFTRPQRRLSVPINALQSKLHYYNKWGVGWAGFEKKGVNRLCLSIDSKTIIITNAGSTHHITLIEIKIFNLRCNVVACNKQLTAQKLEGISASSNVHLKPYSVTKGDGIKWRMVFACNKVA